MAKKVKVEGGYRTSAEGLEASKNKKCFDANPAEWEKKMENFPKYVRRQNLTRYLALYEIFKKVIGVKGSIVECGVHQGFGVMAWTKFSAILEPVNLTRRIYGFDTFEGLSGVAEKDMSEASNHVNNKDLSADSYEELKELAAIHDTTRFLGHIPKIELIKGEAQKTIPAFIEKNPHLLVSLLILDFDIYEPTKTALEYFVPRMPRGAVLVFDELDNPLWPGETLAMLEKFKERPLKIERLPFDPYIAFAVID